MWPFSPKKQEDPTFSERIRKIENEILALNMDIEAIRNNVLRKIQKQRRKNDIGDESNPQKGGIITEAQAQAIKDGDI